MLLLTKKKNLSCSEKFFTLVHFTQWKSTAVKCELSTVSQDVYYSGILI